MQSSKWWLAQFPESLYPPNKRFFEEYRRSVISGHEVLSNSSVVICGTVRDGGYALVKNIARVERLGSLAKKYNVVVVENDSIDQTKEVLSVWSSENENVHVITNDFGKESHGQTRCRSRMEDMAFYRNIYLEYVRENYECDYVIIYDLDIEGGFSYEGVLSSFGYSNWGVMGGNSILYKEVDGKIRRMYFDSFAFQRLGQSEISDDREVNPLVFNRGEPPFEVNSCFGGMAIYNSSAIFSEGTKYGTRHISGDMYECEHIYLHRIIRRNGFKIYLNPSMIVLYNETNYT